MSLRGSFYPSTDNNTHKDNALEESNIDAQRNEIKERLTTSYWKRYKCSPRRIKWVEKDREEKGTHKEWYGTWKRTKETWGRQEPP